MSTSVSLLHAPSAQHDHVEAQAPSRRLNAENRAKIWLTLGMWGCSWLTFTLLTLLEPGRPFVASAVVRAAVMTLGILCCVGLHFLLRSMEARPFSTRAITLIAASPIVAEIFSWINYFGFAWLNGDPMTFVVRDWAAAIRQQMFFTWFFIAWTGLYLAIEYNFLAREEHRRATELQVHAQRAKLEALSNQINPHFLFNSLNSISALVLEGRPQDADRALYLLSSYFRQTLRLDPIEDVPLQREIDLHSSYLAIEHLRYPDMEIRIDVPDRLLAAHVPALILQPIVENAIKHGIARSKPPTCLHIIASEHAGRLELSVINRGEEAARAPRADGDGIGLLNVRNRLRERFGPHQQMASKQLEDGFEVCLSIPLLLP
nr:histidine kinase [uncultured Sphingomonas sp.]